MDGFFAILVTLFFTGVLGGCKRVEVKRGEVVQKESGLERMTLSKANADCKDLTLAINMYCSPKEKDRGCAIESFPTFLFENGQNGSSLTPLNASDGYYVASYHFSDNSVEKVLILVNGTLLRTISPDPPSQENPEARETPMSILGIAVVLIIVGIAVCIIASILKKKNKQSATSDFKKYHIKAGEKTTGDSFKRVDWTPPLEDEDSNSPNEVLIHDTSAGQENGRSDDGNSKHNNINYNKLL